MRIGKLCGCCLRSTGNLSQTQPSAGSAFVHPYRLLRPWTYVPLPGSISCRGHPNSPPFPCRFFWKKLRHGLQVSCLSPVPEVPITKHAGACFEPAKIGNQAFPSRARPTHPAATLTSFLRSVTLRVTCHCRQRVPLLLCLLDMAQKPWTALTLSIAFLLSGHTNRSCRCLRPSTQLRRLHAVAPAPKLSRSPRLFRGSAPCPLFGISLAFC